MAELRLPHPVVPSLPSRASLLVVLSPLSRAFRGWFEGGLLAGLCLPLCLPS